jgi:hypothetical protein
MIEEALTDVERRFLSELDRLGVRYIVIGMTAAVLQGARGATEDIDLWFERLDDPRISDAARTVGGIWVSGTFGTRPPMLGGALGDRFDVVTHVDGADDFATEHARVVHVIVSGISLPLMPLSRVLVSKRASGRSKDQAQIPALEEALIVSGDEPTDDGA